VNNNIHVPGAGTGNNDVICGMPAGAFVDCLIFVTLVNESAKY
jgi:hypothetical protein